MAAPKTGFIMYFDNYPILTGLSMEQRGLLFSALMVYADRVWRDSSVTLEDVLSGFPKLTQEAKIACGFMAAAIQRDTLAWLNKQEYRIKKRQGVSADAVDRRARDDMERTRRLMEQMKKDSP